ncbi:Pr6Pr family membrane protein [Haloferula sp. BvORR071]|uniref:Pr6Pr family membrane protein n=1 Tax=Haloferula sp. BvORR071 TaxID=1396141 RepID=UPI0005577FC3|nr:Pr6Pr family membrane protein [Haloferula sp. BvORR071]
MTLERPLRLAIVLTGIAGLTLQYQVTAELFAARGLGTAAVLWKLSSYFTILTNTLLVLAQAICLVAPSSRPGNFFRSPSIQAALTLYILMVKIIYMSLLAKLWNPEGKQLWADLLHHHVPPLLQLLLWVAYVERAKLTWSHPFLWLSWPASYLIWALAHGGDSPYPFLDLAHLGPLRVALNSAAIGTAFLTGGFALLGLDHLLTPKNPAR